MTLIDAADHRIADDLRAQRVARHVAQALQHRADEGIELTLFDLAVLGDLQAQPLGRDLDLHLAVVDQAERVPAGLGDSAACDD